MTQYDYQTNTALLKEGELGYAGGQLVTKDQSNNLVVVGNPAGATAVEALSQQYAVDAMDVSSAVTLGQGFIFLNGSSYDTTGNTNYEFEETDGRVFGLYCRTDGVNSQVYYAGALNNQQPFQYTTVTYSPPWLSGTTWIASAIVGSDVEGFTLLLSNTAPGNTSAPRYVYVRHNGSLITSSGHTYVEITPMVNSWMTNFTNDTAQVARVVNVGNYFFIASQSWNQGKAWFGGWNAQFTSFPLISTTLPTSPITYNPTAFTVSTNGWPGGDVAASAAPVLMGWQAPGGWGIFRLYNVGTGAITTVSSGVYPYPGNAGWTDTAPIMFEGEVDGSGNPYLLMMTNGAFIDSNNAQSNATIAYSVSVTFTAGSAGAYTNAQFNYSAVGTNGVDGHYVQDPPFYIGVNPTYSLPNETVVSNPATPSTCVNKLPCAHSYLYTDYNIGIGGGHFFFNWYYSGVGSIGGSGAGLPYKRVTASFGSELGSAQAAHDNKLPMIHPMFNVTNRLNLNPNGPNPLTLQSSVIIPSGILSSVFYGMFIGPDLLLSTGYDYKPSTQWVVSQFPAGSTVGDVNYNRFGTSVPGMRARIAEYPVNLPDATTTCNTFMNIWTNGIANIRAPLCGKVNSLNDQGIGGSPNSNTFSLGNWTLSGGKYQPPNQTQWTTSSSLDTQIAAVKASLISAANAAYSNEIAQAYGIEVVPIVDNTGTGILMAIGVLYAKSTASNTLLCYVFQTPAALSGGVISLTNTSSVTILSRFVNGPLFAPVSAGEFGSDVFFGRLFLVYTSATDLYIAWRSSLLHNVPGDTAGMIFFAHFNGTTLQAASSQFRDETRSMITCSAATQGLGIVPYLNVVFPEGDMPVSRYATSAVNAVSDFVAGFTAAFSNVDNSNGSLNQAEILTMDSISNTFILQLGAISGRLNHKEFQLSSTFIDMTAAAPGVYYLYLVDTGANGVQVQYDSAQRTESLTTMYIGTFTRTSGGFSGENAVSEVLRLGTARLQTGNVIAPINGSMIRTGPYPMTST